MSILASAAHTEKVLAKVAENLVNVFKEGANLCTKPGGSTQAERDLWEQHCHDVVKDAEQSVDEETKRRAQEEATKHLIDHGWTQKNAQDWFDHNWKKVIDKVESMRNKKVEDAAKYEWLKLVGAVTAIFTGTLIYCRIHSGPNPETTAALEILHRDNIQQERLKELDQLVVQEDEFNIFIGGIASAPKIEPPPTAPVAAPLPPQIAAAAAVPAMVEVTTSSGTQTYNTTVERVYREAPVRVKTYMQNNPPPPIEHDYNKPTDYHVNLDDYRTKQPHKTFTISSEFASATVSY